mmetsp:Transcript_10907/g.10794  ORF Transcript_10907/g.10794 Transcript_10907/m.10794 type:complete len:86 (-) Transcript_10907:155-412(-)
MGVLFLKMTLQILMRLRIQPMDHDLFLFSNSRAIHQMSVDHHPAGDAFPSHDLSVKNLLHANQRSVSCVESADNVPKEGSSSHHR